jgi:hypothetical protein
MLDRPEFRQSSDPTNRWLMSHADFDTENAVTFQEDSTVTVDETSEPRTFCRFHDLEHQWGEDISGDELSDSVHPTRRENRL